jgi:hypothetical protein
MPLCDIKIKQRTQIKREGIWKFSNNNSVALVRERTIPTERPPLVDEVSVNFSG